MRNEADQQAAEQFAEAQKSWAIDLDLLAEHFGNHRFAESIRCAGVMADWFERIGKNTAGGFEFTLSDMVELIERFKNESNP